MMNTTISTYLVRSLLAFLFALSATMSIAAPPINTLSNGFFSSRTETAINGYDTVAYFTQNAPVAGLDAHTLEWKGAKWKFSSQAHLELFKANPEKYTPQYGGYCAYGIAQNALIKVDPAQFTILDGKLYLNYDADIQKLWAKDRAGFIKQADNKFPALLTK